MASESVRDKLAKKPFLLIAVTSSLSFGMQLVPLRTVTSSLYKNWKALSSANDPFTQLSFMKSSWQFFTPPVLLAVICLVILFILYMTSQRDNEVIGPEEQNDSLIVSKNSSITRTVTLGQSIFAQFIPPPHDEDTMKIESIETHTSLDHEIPKDLISVTLHQQENAHNIFLSHANNFRLASSDLDKLVKSTSEKTQVPAGAWGTKNKMSCPATSCAGVRNPMDPSTSVDTKLDYLPKSFRDDRLKAEKQNLISNRVVTYNLGSSGHQMKQEESLLSTEQLGTERNDSKRCSKPRIKSSPVSISLSSNDVSSNAGIKQKAFSTAKINDDRDLTEAEVNERINAYLSNVEKGFRPQKQEAERSYRRRKRHLKTYSEGLPTQELMKSGSRKTTDKSYLKHTSSQLIRGDSLANDNQKFDSFLQNFRNELRLQKQRSNLRHYFANSSQG